MRITVTVPKNVNEENARKIGARSDEQVGINALLYVKRGMATEFGGYTAHTADGGWVDNDGKLVEESVYIVESYVPDTVTPQVASSIAGAMAINVMYSMVQDAAMYTIDNEAHFVSTEWG